MKYLLSFFSLLLVGTLFAQQPNDAQKTVQWEYEASHDASGGYTLHFSASIKTGWKLFSLKMKDDEPNTRVVFDSASLKLINSVGTNETGEVHREKEALLGDLPIQYFQDKSGINVTLQLKESKGELRGHITYMTIKGDSVTGPDEFPFRFVFDAQGKLLAKTGGLESSAQGSQSIQRSAINLAKPVNECGGTGAENTVKKSWWNIFILGFLGGLIGLFMPCTFPMIPLTVSFFTKQSGNRRKGIFNAVLYGFFIFLIYILLSLPFHFLGASSSAILNNISTNAWLNLFFAVIFIAFALSFFGLYEFTLPGTLANNVGSKSDLGSVGGIFFMALTLAIVSFSCTGPILGTLLVGALNQDGGAMQLTVAMAGFGLALGLPFALFAFFPNWLSTLPRSGSWMNTVKITFGFLELALALKFISNADLVLHWGILKREVFFGLWILIGLLLVLYLVGILKFSYDPPPQKLSKGRIGVAIVFLAFVIYLAPGLTNTSHANRRLISGFPPPLTYSIYQGKPAKEKAVEAVVVNDYEKALAIAKEQNKPLLIDFTGWACVNCRKMEENVWPEEQVRKLIEDKFILVSLYVDDRKQLPADQQFIFTSADGSKKPIKNIGDKFSTLQSENFGNASQPLYAIVAPNETLLNLPVGYTPDATEYAKWLECGLDAFNKISKK